MCRNVSEKHIPIRHCVACRTGKPKIELLSISRYSDSTAPGRSAYICKNSKCVLSAQKKRALERQFKRQIDAAMYDKLLEQCDE